MLCFFLVFLVFLYVHLETTRGCSPARPNETASSRAATWLAAKRREGHHDPRVVLLEAQLEVLAALRQLQLHMLRRRHGEEEKSGPVGQRGHLAVQRLERRLADHTALAPHVVRRFRRGVMRRPWAQRRWDCHDVPRWEGHAELNLRLRVGVCVWCCSGTRPELRGVGLAIEDELDGLVQVHAGQVRPLIGFQGVLVVLVVGGGGHIVVEHRAGVVGFDHGVEELVEQPECHLPAPLVGCFQPILDNSGPHPLFLFLVV